jgi:hypothetical protein
MKREKLKPSEVRYILQSSNRRLRLVYYELKSDYNMRKNNFSDRKYWNSIINAEKKEIINLVSIILTLTKNFTVYRDAIHDFDIDHILSIDLNE